MIQLNTRRKKKKKTTTLPESGKSLNRHFFKDMQMARKHMQRWSTLLIIREMQIKTTMRYYLTPVRIIKKSTNSKCWRGHEEKGLFLHSLLVGMWIDTATVEDGIPPQEMEIP